MAPHTPAAIVRDGLRLAEPPSYCLSSLHKPCRSYSGAGAIQARQQQQEQGQNPDPEPGRAQAEDRSLLRARAGERAEGEASTEVGAASEQARMRGSEHKRANAVRAAARMSEERPRAASERPRVLALGTIGDVESKAESRRAEHFASNRVATTKYNALTFLPRGLYEQFRRVANFYFMVVALLSLTPFSPVRAETTFAPLAFVIGVSLVKEAFEDFKRLMQDIDQNNTCTLTLTSSASFARARWADLSVGSIVQVQRDDALPADLICLKTSSSDGLCHVETKNLDGETNLKPKRAVSRTDGMECSDVARTAGSIECEQPNNRMYTFSGALSLYNAPAPQENEGKVTDSDAAAESERLGFHASAAQQERPKISLSADNLVLRGTFLRNSEWIIGVVVYTGHETKVMKNSLRAPSKRSTIERSMDWIVGFMLLWLFIMCLITGIWFGVNSTTSYQRMWYLKPTIPSDAGAFDDSQPGQVGVFNSITTFVLLGYFIPISLYVSLEIIKVIQAWFMTLDKGMYHYETDTPFASRTTNLNEELGMVNTVLSDKTGTLTQNKMEFFKASIGGVHYGEGMTEVERTLAERRGENVSAQVGSKEPVEPGYNFRDERIDVGAWRDQPHPDYIYSFFFALALCNTAIPEESANEWGVQYQCESPDEASFVVAARRFGIMLRSRQTRRAILDEFGEHKEYDLHEILEFTSNRKRQSIIVRCPDGNPLLLCKGADSVIQERLSTTNDRDIRAETKKHVDHFAAAGLRTLVIAMKTLGEQELSNWQKEFNEAQTAIYDRQSKVEAVEDKLEQGLTLLGATAIEDKLQNGVPRTIESMAHAGIGVWVLTGDKPDTAINISYACNLVRPDMSQFVINIDPIVERINLEGDTHELFEEARKSVEQQLEHTDEEVKALLNPKAGALVVDGRALGHAMSERMAPRLLELMRKCGSVVCCRVSPLQKALITNLAKKEGLSTLAVGDGANDVGMIQKAHIGVGISGQEGMQAVMASDFALAQFCFLERLLVVHGRWNYRRIARFVTYFFYKNIVFGLALFFFSTVDFFSSQRIFNDWHMAGFNVLFAALPIIVVGIFDQDVSQQVSHENVYLYKIGTDGNRTGNLFTLRARAYWFLNGTYQGVFLFFFIFYGVYRKPATERNGMVSGLHQGGLALYTAIVLTINLQLVQMQTYWNWVMHLAVWLTVAIWFAAITIMSEDMSPSFARDQFRLVYTDVFQSATYWLCQPVAIAGALLPDLAYRVFRRRFAPEDLDVVQDVYYRAYNCRCLGHSDSQDGDRKPERQRAVFSSVQSMLDTKRAEQRKSHSIKGETFV